VNDTGAEVVTKVIIIPEENLDRFYERTLERFRAKYHSRPSFLSTSKKLIPQSENDIPLPPAKYSQSHLPMGKMIG
jgi:hypothetical protein